MSSTCKYSDADPENLTNLSKKHGGWSKLLFATIILGLFALPLFINHCEIVNKGCVNGRCKGVIRRLKSAAPMLKKRNISEHLCSEEDFKFGQWIRGAENCGLKNSYTHQESYSGLPQPYPWAQYCWKPLHCNAVPFSNESFCQVLAGRDILFVGDSIHFEMFTALFYQMGEKVEFNQWVPYPLGRARLCNGQVAATFVRNDHLRVSSEVDAALSAKNSHHHKGKVTKWSYLRETNQAWKHLLPLYDIVVLAKGHHAAENRKSQAAFDSETVETVEYLKKHGGSSNIFFVTTSPGHPYCRKNSKAITTPLTTTPNYLTAEVIPPHLKEYQWDRYPINDKFIIDLMKKEELKVTVVNVAPLSFLRPDGHRFDEDDVVLANPTWGDCLHHRIPGVPDAWVFVWFNLLVAQQSLTAIGKLSAPSTNNTTSSAPTSTPPRPLNPQKTIARVKCNYCGVVRPSVPPPAVIKAENVHSNVANVTTEAPGTAVDGGALHVGAPVVVQNGFGSTPKNKKFSARIKGRPTRGTATVVFTNKTCGSGVIREIPEVPFAGRRNNHETGDSPYMCDPE